MLPTKLLDEFVGFLLGDLIGSGVARQVYAYAMSPDNWVVKVEVEDRQFQNVSEWDMWCNAPPEIRKWMAPCHSISAGGRFLLQARCEPCPRHLLPGRMPAIFADIHAGNVGLLEGKPVLFDYGMHSAFTLAHKTKRMQKVYYDHAGTSPYTE